MKGWIKKMKLNIFEKKQIVKTYEADSYDLMFGTVEDIANAVKLDELKTGSDVEIIKLVGTFVVSNMGTVANLLKDIFDGITDEELKKTRVTEIAVVLVEVIKYTIQQLNLSSGKN